MAYKVELTAGELAAIRSRIRTVKNIKLLRRYQCLLLLHGENTKKEVAHILKVNIDTVTDWTKLYLKQGLPGLERLQYNKKRTSLLDDIREQLAAYVQSGRVRNIAGLQRLAEHEHRVKINYSWLCRYCKKNQIVFTKKQPAGRRLTGAAPV